MKILKWSSTFFNLKLYAHLNNTDQTVLTYVPMKGYFFKQIVIYSYSSAIKKNKLWIHN